MPFVLGQEEPAVEPLARYLPPVPPGMVSSWIVRNSDPGDWILDPFGSAPRVVIEAARSGRRVAAAVNNPVTRFTLEVQAAAPREADFRAALADLASSRRGEERLETTIRALYASECAVCGHPVEVKTFLWERGAPEPYARIYTCSACGDSGERSISPADIERLAGFSSGGLHRARALERVAGIDDPTREDVQEAMACYLPRPLYALFTLINRVEGLPVSPARKTLLTALLLSACDSASALWPQPPIRSHPRQLAIPNHFREHNLWIALEEAVREWSSTAEPVPLVLWPAVPPEAGGIALFQGRLKDLAASLNPVPIRGIAAAVPRPGQAFWTLSALWSGWLWGREAVRPLKSVLSRRRYDWNWHAAALEAALANLPEHLQPGTPLWGVFAEVESGFLGAGLIAASRSGFVLEGVALKPEESLAQILWRSKPAGASLGERVPRPEKAALVEMMERRGEPVPYITAYAAAAAGLMESPPPAVAGAPGAPDALNALQNQLKQVFLDRGFIMRFGGGEHSQEGGMWWLAGQPPAELTLSDRVEMDVVRALQKGPVGDVHELERALCDDYPGFLTPSLGYLKACLESYGQEDPPGSGRWSLRPQDQPAVRRSDLKEEEELLQQLGRRLGYRVENEGAVVWKLPDGGEQYAFYIMASTLIGRYVRSASYPAEISLLVMPGSRSNLLAIKLRMNPVLQKYVSAGWRFLKFRHLRSLAVNPLMDREQWATQLENDPPEISASQLSLF